MVRSEADQIRDALREVAKGLGITEVRTYNALDALVEHASDERLLHLRRLIR